MSGAELVQGIQAPCNDRTTIESRNTWENIQPQARSEGDAGTPVIALTASPGGLESVQAFVEASQELGGTIIEAGLPGRGGPQVIDPALIPLIEIIPLQQLALNMALGR